MEQFSPAAIYEIARSLEQLRAACNFIERAGVVRFAGQEVDPNQMESIELNSSRTRREFLPGYKSSVISILDSIEKHCALIGLNLAARAASEYKAEFDSGRVSTYSDASQAYVALDKIIQLQLRDNLFLFVQADRAKFYGKSELFGTEVNTRLPDLQFDIEEAGNCLAAGRGTACAFHLMRIMEAAVQELGTVLGIGLSNDRNWQNLLDEINKAIKSLSSKDARTIAISQAAGHLYNVKVAWRNPTMHPKITYTVEEATDLLTAVKAFMIQLTRVL